MDHMPNPIAMDANISQIFRWKKLFFWIRSFIEMAVNDARLAMMIDKITIGSEYSPLTSMPLSMGGGENTINPLSKTM